MELNNTRLLETVINKDYISNKDIVYIYNCCKATASRIMNDLRAFAESDKPGITNTFIYRQVTTDYLLKYLNKDIDDLITQEERKQRLEALLHNKRAFLNAN